MFDARNKVAGVMVMGEGKPAGAQPGRPGAQPPRVATPPASTTRPAPTDGRDEVQGRRPRREGSVCA
jgi:hypothetical protein